MAISGAIRNQISQTVANKNAGGLPTVTAVPTGQQATDWMRDRIKQNVTEKAGPTFIKSFLSNANGFLQSVDKDIYGDGGFNAAEFFAERQKQAESLKRQADIAGQYLDQYGDTFDQKDYDYLRDYLSNFNTNVDDVLSLYQPSLDAQAGVQSYQDAYRAYQEEQARKGQKWNISADMVRATDAPYAQPVAGLLDFIGSIAGTPQNRGVTDQWTAQQRYNLGVLQNEDPLEAQKYAREINKGQDPYQIGMEAEQEKQTMLSQDLNVLQGEIDELENRYWNYSYDSSTPMGEMAGQRELDRMEQEINDKKRYLNNARRLQDAQRMAEVSGNADFAANSKYVSTARAGISTENIWGYTDPIYEYINGNAEAREYFHRNRRAEAELFDHLAPEETAIYNYYYATAGKAKAEEYLHTIEDTLNSRRGAEIGENLKDKSYLQNMMFAGMVGLDNAFNNTINNLNFTGEYRAPSAYQYAAQNVKENLADTGPMLPEFLGGGSLGQVGFDLVNTFANMAPSVVLGAAAGPVAGTALLGASAAGGAYQEALNLGYSKGQARLHSALVGGSEAGLEYLLGGISALGGEASGAILEKMLSGVDNAFKRAALTLGGNMVSEGFEEGLQEILTPYFQNLALRSNENVNWNEVAYSTLLGALSGGLMEGPGAIRSAWQQSRAGSLPGTSVAEEVDLTTNGIRAKVAEDGRGRIISTNESADVQNFASIQNGEAMIQLKNGDTVPMSDINFATPEEAARFMTAKSLPGIETEAANDLVTAMESNNAGSDLDTLLGVRDAYRLGYYGFDKTDASRYGTDAAKLSPALRTAIYEVGQKQRAMKAAATPVLSQSSVQTANEKPTVKPAASYKRVVFEGKVKLKGDKKAAAEVRFMDYVADKISGTTVHVYQSYKGRDGKYYYRDIHGNRQEAPNGKYVDDEIWIDLNAGDKGEGLALNTFGHEMYHHVEKWNQQGAQKLAEFVVKELGMKDVKSAVDAQIKKATAAGYGVEHFKSKGMTEEQAINTVEQRAMSDFVADSLETMFSRGDAAEVITRLKEEDRGLFDKIKEFVDQWVSTLKQWYSDKTISKEGKQVAQLERFEELQQLFMDAVSEAGENYQSAVENYIAEDITNEKSTTLDSDTMFHSRKNGYDYSVPFSQQVDDWINGTFPIADTLIVGGVPDVMKKIGFPSIPITLSQVNLKANINGQYKGTPSEILDHIVNSADFKRLPELISDPVAIIVDRRLKNNQWTISEHIVDVLVEMNINGKQTLVPIKIDGQGKQNGTTIDSLSIASIHGNKDAYNRLEYALKNDSDNQILVFYVNKNKANAVLRKAGYTITGWPNTDNGFIHKITDKKSPVKLKVSTQTESRQFKNWFGTSKIVNSDGTPKIMYHGSPAQFSRFDRKKAKSSGLYGKGFYFTDSDSHAKTYGNTYSVYLNIRNPLQSGSTTVTRQQVRSYLEAVAENEDYSIENYGTYDVDAILNTVMGKDGKTDAFKVIQDINATAIGDMVEAAELFNSVNGTAFDGIVVPTETVAFYPEQIKSATDNIGTFDGKNDDIYHSLRNVPDDVHAVRRRIADAFDSIAVTPPEKKWAAEYREKIAQAETIESNLKITNRQIQEKTKSKNPADKKGLGKLKDDATRMQNDLDKLNRRIHFIESLKSFRDTTAREAKAYGKSMLQNTEKRWRENIQQQLLEDRVTREELTGKDSDITIMEKEFIRIVKEYEKLDIKARKFTELRKSLEAEAKSHKQTSQEWQKKFNQLLRDYETSGRKIAELEGKLTRQRQLATARVQSRRNTELRNKIQRKANELNTLLTRPTKHRNIPEYLQPAVADIMDAINMEVRDGEARRKTYEATLQRYDQRIAAETDPAKIRDLIEKRNQYAAKGDQFANRVAKLKEAYDKIRENKIPGMEIDEGLSGKLDELFKKVGDTPLGQMTSVQLAAVNDVLDITKATIVNANKMFREGQKANVEENSQTAMSEVRSSGGERKKGLPAVNMAREFLINNLKPIYAFEMIGSNTLTDLFKGVRDGEGTLARDLSEAKEFYRQQWDKHHGKDWDMDKKYRFESTSGKTFELDINQIMSLYALSKREQARSHLRKGGFAFEKGYKTREELKVLGMTVAATMESTDASAYNLSDEILGDIISKLSAEQKAFVDEMQRYLSKDMAAKGNAVSLIKYGIRLFLEENYFPLRIADQYMARKREQQAGDSKLKNSGFTKETVPDASNPVVLGGFTDVWAEHVDEMSLYHSFVLPLDDLERVLNYHSQFTEEGEAQSVMEAIRNAYGEGASKYIDQLIRDINGGARADGMAKYVNQTLSKAKKAQTMASLSVAIQQPSSILRATSMIDGKYFIGPKVTEANHKHTWAELKKYAPLAIIKEMGGFDVNVGQSTVDYLTDTTEYTGILEKAEGLLKDSKYRDEVLGRLPALMDELSWGAIWQAVKREQRELRPNMDVKSEAFLKMCGKRFEDIIVHTQVYDSVFSRSGMMRSKDTGIKALTSYMAEPTTTANMLYSALLQAKRGGSKAQVGRTAAALAGALVVNSASVALVYAMRDDDEDKRFDEKWVENFRENVLEGLNPLGYLPVLRDLNSMAKGFDVKRMDMALYGDVVDAIQSLPDEDKTPWQKVEAVTGAVGNLLGVPVKNILRDGKGIFNTISIALDDTSKDRSTRTGYRMALTGKNLNNGEQLLLAIQSGDEAHWTRVAERFDSLEDAVGALKTAIGNHYKDGSITDEEATELLMTYADMEADDVYWKFEEWSHARDKGNTENYSKFGALHQAIENGENIETEINRYVEHGTDISTIRSDISRVYKKEYLAEGTDREAVRGKVAAAYMAAGLDEEEIREKFRDWDFEAEYGMSYSEFKGGYLDDTVSERELREAMKFYGRKNYQIESDIRNMNEDKEFRARFDMSLSEMKDAYDDGDISRNQLIAALEFTGKTRDEARQEVTERDIENRLGIDYMELDDAYKHGDISRTTLYNAMREHGATVEEADEAIAGYDWLKKHVKQHPDLTISDGKKFAVSLGSNAEGYTLEDYGVSISAYKTYKAKLPDCKGVDANGDGKTDSGTKRDAIMRMIDTLPISDEAKTGLALMSYSKNSIRKNAPWMKKW